MRAVWKTAAIVILLGAGVALWHHTNAEYLDWPPPPSGLRPAPRSWSGPFARLGQWLDARDLRDFDKVEDRLASATEDPPYPGAAEDVLLAAGLPLPDPEPVWRSDAVVPRFLNPRTAVLEVVESDVLWAIVMERRSGTWGELLRYQTAFVFSPELSPIDVGRVAYAKKGCNQCHSTDGSILHAPSFLGLWGKTETLRDGTQIAVDEEYVRTSILEPRKHVVDGFNPVMPPYAGRISRAEFDGIVTYLRSLATEPIPESEGD